MNNKLKNIITRLGCGGLALLSTTSLSCKINGNNNVDNEVDDIVLSTEEVIDDGINNENKERKTDLSYIPIVMYPERNIKNIKSEKQIEYENIYNELNSDSKKNIRMFLQCPFPQKWKYVEKYENNSLKYFIYCFTDKNDAKKNDSYPQKPTFVVTEFTKTYIERIEPGVFSKSGEEFSQSLENAFTVILNNNKAYNGLTYYTKHIKKINITSAEEVTIDTIKDHIHTDKTYRFESVATMDDGEELYQVNYLIKLKNTQYSNDVMLLYSIVSKDKKVLNLLDNYFITNSKGFNLYMESYQPHYENSNENDKYMSPTPIVYNQSGYTRKRTLMNK